MNKTDSLQIGHSFYKRQDFKIECEVTNDIHVEVPFSHRHFFYAIYWVHEGNGVHIIDFEEYKIKPDRIFFIKPEQIHFLRGDASMKYSALQCTEDFMIPLFSKKQNEIRQRKIAVYKDLDKIEKERIAILFRQLHTETIDNLPNNAAIMQSEINTLLLELERMNMSVSNDINIPFLLQKYEDLIETQFITEKQVKKYAIQLGISANYLNVLSQKYFGKSALDMINERVILEIKRLLLRTNCSISEIAYKIGFNELSYFSRFFKRNTGMTPLEF